MTGTPAARRGRRDHERAGADRVAGGLRPRGVRLAHLPSWPLAFELRGVAVPDDGAYESDEETTGSRRRSASWTAPSRSPSAVNTSTANAPSRRSRSPVVCAVPCGHLTLSAAPPASPTADSSPSPSSTLALHPPLSRPSDSSGRDAPQTCYAYLPLDFKIRCATHLLHRRYVPRLG
jgi:hypothetical protein